jgi:hypothetical protein
MTGVQSLGSPGPEIGRTLSDANDFLSNGLYQVMNFGAGDIDADLNWWGDACPDPGTLFYGLVNYSPWTDESHSGAYTECTGVPDEGTWAASSSHNYPNPFNPITRISYTVPGPGEAVRIAVYNISGRLVSTLVNESKPGGEYEVLWQGRDDQGRELGSGVYFCKIEIGEYRAERKMILLK